MKPILSVLVRNEEQYKIVKKFPIVSIYSSEIEVVKNHPEVYYQVRGPLKEVPDHLLIQDIGLLNSEKDIITDYQLNIANEKSLEFLLTYNVKKITLSLECTLEELRFFKNLKAYPIEVLIYGKPEDMVLKRHPIIKNNMVLESVTKEKYKCEVDDLGQVHIFHHSKVNLIDKINDYVNLGISMFRIDFLDESNEEIETILQKICQVFTLID